MAVEIEMHIYLCYYVHIYLCYYVQIISFLCYVC